MAAKGKENHLTADHAALSNEKKLSLHHKDNPIIQGEPGDTLAHCSDCLAYLSESAGCINEGEVSSSASMGLQMLLDCVRSAVDFEAQRLSPSIDNISPETDQ